MPRRTRVRAVNSASAWISICPHEACGKGFVAWSTSVFVSDVPALNSRPEFETVGCEAGHKFQVLEAERTPGVPTRYRLGSEVHSGVMPEDAPGPDLPPETEREARAVWRGAHRAARRLENERQKADQEDRPS
jgi:hypothetical protein